LFILHYAVLGKSEGEGKNWHGHVTAVSIAPEFRRMGVAARLMNLLELTSDKLNCFFVDLFVRESNAHAIGLYQRLGYERYRRVLNYYSNLENEGEDAFDMRKPLSHDKTQESVKAEHKTIIRSNELENN
jgi:N-terminal acetyltransferase B complex catalytic subunit